MADNLRFFPFFFKMFTLISYYTLIQLNNSSLLSMSYSQLGCASLIFCSKTTRARCLIVKYTTIPLKYHTKLSKYT